MSGSRRTYDSLPMHARPCAALAAQRSGARVHLCARSQAYVRVTFEFTVYSHGRDAYAARDARAQADHEAADAYVDRFATRTPRAPPTRSSTCACMIMHMIMISPALIDIDHELKMGRLIDIKHLC